MATRKDLLDAFTFSRRRMISNVLQPSSTGTDEAAPRPVRNFTAGITLAIVLVLVFLLIGVFKGNGASASTNVLLLDKDTGGRYIVQNGRAYPVANVASAELVLNSPMTVQTVSDSAITKLGKTVGPTVGIPGLPDFLPSATDLDLNTWTACSVPATATASTTQLGVGYGAATPLGQNQGLVVRDTATGTYYVLTNGRKYPIDAQYAPTTTNTNTVLTALGWIVMNGVRANDNFLATIPSGGALTVPIVTDAGHALGPAVNGGNVFTKVGQYGTLSVGNGTTDYLIMTSRGVAQVSAFAYTLYRNGAGTSLGVGSISQIGSITTTQSTVGLINGTSGDWPSAPVSLQNGDTNNMGSADICATSSNGAVTLSTTNALAFGNGGTSPQQPTAAQADTVYVKGGHGVIVSASDGGAAGKHYLVTDTGLRYQLDSALVTQGTSTSPSSVSAQSRLGYDKVKALTLPSAWIQLIQEGPDMNPGSARCTEQVAGEASTCLDISSPTGTSS
jgi:type VII secretion protein EccB